MAYHVTKDLKAEIKVGGSLFLKDLMGLILFPAIMYFLTGAIVADGLKIVYRLQCSCCVSVIAASEKQSGKTGVANLSLDNERG